MDILKMNRLHNQVKGPRAFCSSWYSIGVGQSPKGFHIQQLSF